MLFRAFSPGGVVQTVGPGGTLVLNYREQNVIRVTVTYERNSSAKTLELVATAFTVRPFPDAGVSPRESKPDTGGVFVPESLSTWPTDPPRSQPISIGPGLDLRGTTGRVEAVFRQLFPEVAIATAQINLEFPSSV